MIDSCQYDQREDQRKISVSQWRSNQLTLTNWHMVQQYYHQSLVFKTCQPDIELLSVNLRPKYLPREFSNIFVTLVYIPPSGNKEKAAELVSETVSNLSDEKLNAVQIVQVT